MATDRVRIYEICLSDGLLAGGLSPSPELRQQMVEMLGDCGLAYVEVGAFGSGSEGEPGVTGTLTLAERAEVEYAGLLREFASLPLLRESGLETLSLRFHAHDMATEKLGSSWSISNVLLALDRMEPWLPDIVAGGYRVRATIYDAFDFYGKPGPVAFDLLACARGLLELGCFQISFVDTMGSASPRIVRQLVGRLLETFGPDKVAFQFHDGRGRGLVNFYAAWLVGARNFDTVLAGIGSSQTGSTHLVTEDLVWLCEDEQIDTGVDSTKLLRAARFITKQLGIPIRSRCASAQPSGEVEKHHD